MPNPYLPPEPILDYTVDLLHGKPETLMLHCLELTGVPRTRKHLFADIKSRSASDLGSWEKAFLDVADSPAYHTRTLFVGCPGSSRGWAWKKLPGFKHFPVSKLGGEHWRMVLQSLGGLHRPVLQALTLPRVASRGSHCLIAPSPFSRT